MGKPLKLHPDDCLVCGCLFKSVDGLIEKLKEKAYSESEYGVDEFDASKVIQLSDAIEIIKDYCGAKMEEGEGMKWEWENKVSLQRLLQKLKDADSSGAVLTKAEAKFVYDLYDDKVKVLEKIKAEIDEDHNHTFNDGCINKNYVLSVIDKYMAESEERYGNI